MKICIATHSIDKKDGGPSRSVPILAKGLSELGMDVTILTVNTPNMNQELLQNTSVKLVLLPSKGYRRMLKSFFKTEHFDIIHSQNLWTPYYHWIARITRKLSIPYIMTPRGTLEPWSLQQKKLKKLLALSIYQRRDLNMAKCVLATSEMEAESIKHIKVTSPVAIIPNGIDLTEYPCRSNQENLNIKKRILFLSRIHKKKGIELLINSWSELREKYPDWTISIVGNGDANYIRELKDTIKKKGLEGSVSILPPVFGTEKVTLYKESSLFVLPTYSENFGMVIAEAMACGLPVVTTTGTPWKALKEHDLGWYVEINQSSLTNALDEALNTGIDSLNQRGQRASLYVNSNFSYLEIAKKCLLLYKWILGKSQKPSFVMD